MKIERSARSIFWELLINNIVITLAIYGAAQLHGTKAIPDFGAYNWIYSIASIYLIVIAIFRPLYWITIAIGKGIFISMENKAKEAEKKEKQIKEDKKLKREEKYELIKLNTIEAIVWHIVLIIAIIIIAILFVIAIKGG